MSLLRGRPWRLVRDEAGLGPFGFLVVLAIVLVVAIVLDQTRFSTPGTTLAKNKELNTEKQKDLAPLILKERTPPPSGRTPPPSGAEPPSPQNNCLAVDDADSDAGVTHGAGSTAPRYTDCGVTWSRECKDDDMNGISRVRITAATIHMWTTDGSMDVMKFRYRHAPRGAAAGIASTNWSEWAEATLAPEKIENETRVAVVTAPEHGQTFSPDAEWDLQVELEFGKDRARDRHYLYSYPIVASCTVDFSI